MPPKRKPRAPRAPKCSYVEDGRRCGADGEGNPPLCPPHTAILRATAEAPYNPLGSIVDSLKNGRPVSFGDAIAAGADLLATMLGGRTFVPPQPPSRAPGSSPPPSSGAWDPVGQWWQEQQRRQQQQQRPRQDVDELAADRVAARRAFGWPPGKKLDGDELKTRYRELAKKNHPDRGGSPDRMAKINHAMDVLTVELKSR